MKRIGRRVLLAYLLLSGALVAGLAAVVLVGGTDGFYAIQGPEDVASVETKFAWFCVAWLFVGALTVLGQVPDFARRHAALLVVLALVAFSTLNFVREPHRTHLGDFRAYFLAAQDMSRGQPIDQEPHRLYLYPPLLATMLQPLVPAGITRAHNLFTAANVAAMGALVALLCQTLQRYGFSRELAALASLIALTANVPVERTIVVSQVNLHVLNLMLLAFLLHPKRAFGSALCLALATHLKVYPVVLALPFLLAGNVRWLGWFGASNAAIILVTSLVNDPSYYLQFLSQVTALEETGIRNVSVDSFVSNSVRLWNLDPRLPWPALSAVVRAALAAIALWGFWRWSRVPDGARRPETDLVRSGWIVLPVLMLVASPSVWPHHLVLLVPTAAVLASRLARPIEAWTFLAAYVLAFLVPVNEIYPVSYLRLAALGLLLASIHQLADRRDEPPWFSDLKRRWTLPGDGDERRA